MLDIKEDKIVQLLVRALNAANYPASNTQKALEHFDTVSELESLLHYTIDTVYTDLEIKITEEDYERGYVTHPYETWVQVKIPKKDEKLHFPTRLSRMLAGLPVRTNRI